MTDAHLTRSDFSASAPRAAAHSQAFTLTPDVINGLVVIGGSLAMALAGIAFGAWLQLPFGG